LVRIVDILPPEQNAELATWPLIKSDTDDCDILVTNLLVLRRRAAAQADFAQGLWTTLQSKQDCQSQNDSNVGALIDQILDARPGLDEFGHYLIGQTQTSDLG
jgi:hypothetical protein